MYINIKKHLKSMLFISIVTLSFTAVKPAATSSHEATSFNSPRPLVDIVIKQLVKDFTVATRDVNGQSYSSISTHIHKTLSQLPLDLIEALNNEIRRSLSWQEQPYLKEVISPTKKYIKYLLFNKTGSTLLASSLDKKLYIIKIDDGSFKTIHLPMAARSLALSDDGRYLAALLYKRKLMVLDSYNQQTNIIETPELFTHTERSPTSIEKIEFCKDDQLIKGTLYSVPQYNIAWKLKDIFQQEIPEHFFIPKEPTSSFDDKKPFAYINAYNNQITVCADTSYDLSHIDRPSAHTFCPNYNYLAVGMTNGKIALWHCPNWQHYLLQRTIRKTKVARKPLVYIELIKALEQNKNDIFHQLPKEEQTKLLNDLKINIEALRQSVCATNRFEILIEQNNIELARMHIQNFALNLVPQQTNKRKIEHATDTENLETQRLKID
ncbi:MAG: WD40 repeat domain-containing protein [Candidatus Dependentiae bacterium]